MVGPAFRKFLPLVLVKRSTTKTLTKGCIMSPEKSRGKVMRAIVIAIGLGSKGKGGEIQPVSTTVRDEVLLPEYRGINVVLDGKDSFFLEIITYLESI
ncbi:10 kDa heat shock protein, mitochondrial-like [Macaca thibetana thibetana]|uniref:10 kDa heat shock protein, mitochondrial-like n=1 Tax=Macaca thibetana thibetana TaxID=257877 RepID=UPI0021BCD335|nr:10 kDa heat shock protein, mitochondrial-like [Macaca thibetana thibetana]